MSESSRGERRLAVLLFADLSGYTRLCRTLDPEDVAATVLPLLADVRSAVTAEGGIATGVAGDGFLAVFGVPVSHVDIADRAVRAALEMRRIVHARSVELSNVPVPDIHIGITAGEVLAYPSDDPSGLSFIGPAINLAARLSDAATAGKILVDDHLRRLVSDKSSLSAPREIVLQGHEEGVRVWDLAPSIPAPRAGAVPFVGREDLLRQLDEAFDRARGAEQLSVIQLHGEAGIGKSTLLREWLRRRPSSSVVWINCIDVPFGAHVDELTRQLRLLAAVDPADRPDTSWHEPAAVFARPSEDVARKARDLAKLLPQVAPEGMAIVLDDFQAADDELAAVVETLASMRSPAPALIVCPVRSDDRLEQGNGSELVVPPLDDDAVTALVAAALGATPPEPVVSALLDRAEGRPLAALQSSAYLVESGTVAVHDDRCELLAPQQLSDLPDTMRLFVAGRLDRLPPAEKQLAQELSAVGTNVRVELVEQLFGVGSRALLNALVARGLLVRNDTHVGFSHGVVHEVAYASLPRAIRARLHRRIVEDNAFHDEATRALHARRWAAAATESAPADRRIAVAAALRHTLVHAQSLYTTHVRNAYAEARTVRSLLEEDAGIAPAVVARLLVLLAGCDIHAGRYDDALAGAGRAIQVCRDWNVDTPVLVAALCAQGEALSQLRHYQSARQALDEAVRIADDAGYQIGRGRALRLLGDTFRHSDSLQLLALTEEAFDVLATCGDEEGAAEAARMMAYWLSVSTAPKWQRWIDEAERRTPFHDVRGRVELSRTRAFASAAHLDFGTAREQARLCRDLGKELGIGDVTIDGLMLGIESAAALGLLTEAVALLDELERLATRRAEPRIRQMAAVVGLQPLQRAGALARAGDALSQVVSLRDAFGPPEAMMGAAALGLAARDRGSWAEAIDHLHAALGASDAAGFALSSLVLRLELVLTSAILGTESADGRDVAQLAAAAGAPAIVSSVHSAMALIGSGEQPTTPPATVLEAAVRADAHALHLEASGEQVATAWRDAAEQWERLGFTVFLARAQARAGNVNAAEETLDAVGAADDGRRWALQR